MIGGATTDAGPEGMGMMGRGMMHGGQGGMGMMGRGMMHGVKGGGMGMMHGDDAKGHRHGMHDKHRKLLGRLDLLEAHMIKIEVMLEKLLQR